MATISATTSQRRNLNIDSDSYSIAEIYAKARGISVSAAVSELLRRAEEAPAPPSPLLTTNRLGLPIVSRFGRVVDRTIARRIADGEDEN